MIAVIFQCFIILLVFVLLVIIYCLVDVNQQLTLRNKAQEAEIDSLRYRNQVLLNQTGDDLICWSNEDNKNIEIILDIVPERNVVISGRDLQHIYNARFKQGRNGDKIDTVPLELEHNQCTNKRFDGMYREHVNELRDVAVAFHDAGQLRARISDKVLSFRDKLNKLQTGKTP